MRSSPTHATPQDINAPAPGNRHGGVGDRRRHGEYGTVISYHADTYTATLRTEQGRTISGVPRLRSSPGDIAGLEQGTEVLISHEYGDPIIMGVVSTPNRRATDTARFSATDVSGFGGQGLNKGVLGNEGNYRSPSEPDDMTPSDWVQISTDGNLIGVLGGGVNVIRSSALAQIRTHLVNDVVEVISRNYRHISDMGEQTIQNNNGRINMRFRGGSDQRSEAGPDEENWTIKFDLGSEGDVLNFELCTPQGQTLFRFHVDSDGKCEIFGINGVSTNSGSQGGGASVEENTGDKHQKVGGSQTQETAGDKTTTINGSQTTTVANNSTHSAGNDASYQALRDLAFSSGRNTFMAIQGDGLNDALVIDIDSGHWVTNIGGPTSLNPLSGYELNTFAGDIEFNSQAGGNFNVTSQLGVLLSKTRKATLATNMLPDSVILGGDNLASHVVKYEQLAQLLRLLFQMLDRHVHIENGTSVAAGFMPVTGVSGPPVVPFSPALNPSVPTCKSITTGVSL